MELIDGALQIDTFMGVTMGIIVLFVGKRINSAVNLLQEFSIPEPVTGGLLFALVFSLVYVVSGISVEFDLRARDILLVYFFTTIGINSSLKDLVTGGKPLIVLLSITIAFIFLQNLTGITVARMLGLDGVIGLLGGSVSLLGGYGTTIAWSPNIAETLGVSNAMEIGIACATFGLILASVMGGPIAKFLINKHQLKSAKTDIQDVGLEQSQKYADSGINYLQMLNAILALHICIILGVILHSALESLGFALPLFVTCLFAGILLTNALPNTLSRLSGEAWPCRTQAIALIAEISLGTFLAMSLMSLQLWKLVDLAGPILMILLAQLIMAVIVNLYVVFPLMGRNYDAAIICSGFGGISLGSTPTAMANMASVTQRYGASHLAFIVVPLVCAFFLDLANALIIPLFLSWV